MDIRERGTWGQRRASWTWLTVAIVLHLVVSVAHGSVHAAAHVLLSLAARLFVYVVITAGPLVGLALTWANRRLGSLVIAATMMGALVFGAANHFIIAGPDHVGQVEAQWQLPFGVSAVLLALTEAMGVGLAIAMVRTTASLDGRPHDRSPL